MTSNTKLLELLYNCEKSGYLSTDTEKLFTALKDNIREENSKKSGTKKTLTIVKGIIKVNTKCNPALAGYIKYNDKFAFTEGHRIIVTDSSFDYEPASNQIDISKFNNSITDCKVEIDINEVKNTISMNKANKTNKPYICYTENGIKVGLNANYVLDAYSISGSTTFYCEPKASYQHNCQITPIFQFDNDNNILNAILPVCVKEGE